MKNFLPTVLLALAISASVNAATVIDPISATATSTFDGATGANNTANGSGLSNASIVETGDPSPGTWPSHSRENGVGAGFHWHSAVGVLTPTITFDLGEAFNVEGFRLWNHNQNPSGTNNLTNRGIRNVDVLVSLNNTLFTPLTTFTNLAQAPGLNAYTGEHYSLTASNVRYIRFNVTQNWGSTDVTGMSEIRFEGAVVPEPGTAVVLLVLGLFVIIIHNRRRRAQPSLATSQSPRAC